MTDADDAADAAVALAAVRLLGADVLAPYALTGAPLPFGEAEAVRLALDALPPVQPPPAAPPAGDEQTWVLAWSDWGLVTLLGATDPAAANPTVRTNPTIRTNPTARTDPTAAPDHAIPDHAAPGQAPDHAAPHLVTPADSLPLQPPHPQGPPLCDDSAPRHLPPTADDGPDGPVREGWAPWSVRLGRLASLALPGLDGPVHEAARAGALGLARGASRATLRRDFATAARITRWLAWLQADGVALPLDPAPLTNYIRLAGGDGGRLALDTAIARRLLGLEPV
ncbi:hypothetical protein [Streptomyces varsoviensis]|nr:hypothetical protein [Streptomyces varsoviensis]